MQMVLPAGVYAVFTESDVLLVSEDRSQSTFEDENVWVLVWVFFWVFFF